MIKNLVVLNFCLVNLVSWGQSFAPAAGQIGSSAIHKDSSIIIAWAATCSVTRGPRQIDHPEFGLASFGSELNGVGQAEGNSTDIVSLGDGGVAVLTFNPPIRNGNGPDFAIFENGFTDHYMEFAFVEVSSNGIDYFRFPAVSQVPLIPQMTNGSVSNCSYVHNLAGKYRQGYGTPFDLQDLDSISNLDLNAISYVRLLDAVGNVDSIYGTTDAYGNFINDPWPTNFESSGFDLDGVAVMNQGEMNLGEKELKSSIAPNPFFESLNICVVTTSLIFIANQVGEIVYSDEIDGKESVNLDFLKPGMYYLKIASNKNMETIKIVKR